MFIHWIIRPFLFVHLSVDTIADNFFHLFLHSLNKSASMLTTSYAKNFLYFNSYEFLKDGFYISVHLLVRLLNICTLLVVATTQNGYFWKRIKTKMRIFEKRTKIKMGNFKKEKAYLKCIIFVLFKKEKNTFSALSFFENMHSELCPFSEIPVLSFVLYQKYAFGALTFFGNTHFDLCPFSKIRILSYVPFWKICILSFVLIRKYAFLALPFLENMHFELCRFLIIRILSFVLFGKYAFRALSFFENIYLELCPLRKYAFLALSFF